MIKLFKAVFAVIGVLLLIGILTFAGVAVFDSLAVREPYTSESDWSGAGLKGVDKKYVREACERHISESERKARQAVDRRAKEFSEYIRECKSGAEYFADDILSFYGKWRAMKPYIPFTDSDGHKQYVQEKFNQHIISEQRLADVLRRTIEDIAQDIDAIENELAVNIRRELLGRNINPSEIPIAKREFERSLGRAVGASSKEALIGAGSFIAAETIGVLLTMVGRQVLISSGIIRRGVVGGPYTIGIGILIGIIVDAIFQMVMDSKGDVQRELNRSIDAMAKNGADAIRRQMTEIMDERARGWKEAVNDLINNS